MSATESRDTSFNVVDYGRFIAYHAGGADLMNSFRPGSGVPRFPDAVLAMPQRTMILLVREVSERNNYVVIEGGGPVVRVVGDDSQGFPTRYGPDIIDVARAFYIAGIAGLTIFDNYDSRRGYVPLLGTLLAHHVVIAAQYQRYHTLLDHLINREEAPYGVLIYAEDVIGRRTVNLRRFVNLIETRQQPRRMASVFRVIRPLRGRYTIQRLIDVINNLQAI
ncbi:MAG: hypothetical protein GSR73_03840 [Desulfurococcales archaeon]|nr:hypothetical protein [Desulfurococcales archaeon]